MCSDGRMIWTPTDVKLGNLICLEVSSLMAWHGFLGSAGSEVLSHSRCWIMVVSNCWKTIRPEGPVRSVHSQLGKQGFPLTRPRLYFFYGWKGGHPKVNVYVTACEIIFSRCIYIYKPRWRIWKSHFIWQETLLDMWAHLCGAYLASYNMHLPVHVSISLHACVFFFGSVMAADLLFLEDDYGPRKFPGR